MYAPVEISREGPLDCRQSCLGWTAVGLPPPPEPLVHAAVDGSPLQKSTRSSNPRWAGRARPSRSARSASATPASTSSTARRTRDPLREGPRDQGDDHRARRQDHDGQGLPRARPLRGRPVNRPGVHQAPRGPVSRARHPGHNDELAQPRDQHPPVRPRRGAHRGSHQPLQHDVRPVFHGRQPGGLRARAELGRHQHDPGQGGARRSRAGRCRCSSRAASRRSPRTSSTPSPMQGARVTTASRPPRTASNSPRARNSAGRRPTPACATCTCSSTGSATRQFAPPRRNLFDVKIRAIENLRTRASTSCW